MASHTVFGSRISSWFAPLSLFISFSPQAQHILNEHIEHRRQERVEDPARFDKKPTLGELAVRHPPLPEPVDAESVDKTMSARSKPRSVKLVDTKSRGRG